MGVTETTKVHTRERHEWDGKAMEAMGLAELTYLEREEEEER